MQILDKENNTNTNEDCMMSENCRLVKGIIAIPMSLNACQISALWQTLWKVQDQSCEGSFDLCGEKVIEGLQVTYEPATCYSTICLRSH